MYSLIKPFKRSFLAFNLSFLYLSAKFIGIHLRFRLCSLQNRAKFFISLIMKTKLTYFFLFFLSLQGLNAQDLLLAEQYLKSGEEEKALAMYLQWFERQRRYSPKVYEPVLKIYLRQGQYTDAEIWIRKNAGSFSRPVFDIDLYHIYILKGEREKAARQFSSVENSIRKNPGLTQAYIYRLKNYHYLNEALRLIRLALARQPSPSLYLQAGRIYAEQGEVKKMAEAYLQTLEMNENYLPYIQNYLSPYLSSDPDNKYNRIFKNEIIRRIPERPLPQWLQLLQWIYTREKNYAMAFTQARARFMQGAGGTDEIIDLGAAALEDRQYAIARDILDFALSLENLAPALRDRALWLKVRLEKETLPEKSPDLPGRWIKTAATLRTARYKWKIYHLLLDTYIWEKKSFPEAQALIDSLLHTSPPPRQAARLKEKKADIRLLQRRFDEAAIAYTLLREDYPYLEINYRAAYKIALASFFAGDIDWAHTTLKVLKKATDKKIANDALQLDYLIIAHRNPSDTVHTALQKFAGLYFDYYAGNDTLALRRIAQWEDSLSSTALYDDLLYLKARILMRTGHEKNTVDIWKKIAAFDKDKIYREEALYRLGVIYEKYFHDPVQAKTFYKKILLDYPQGFWFEPARQRFRRLTEKDEVL